MIDFTERVLLLDGAMGTMIQRYGLGEEDFRGNLFKDHSCDLRGNNDILSLTRPDVISEIHRHYAEAGADIITTNSFNSNRLSQRDYGLEDSVRTLNMASALIARRVAEEEGHAMGKKIYVAGSMGPTSHSLSLGPDVENPAFRDISFDELAEAYHEQAVALIDGGVDILLLETIFDTLNLKAAIEGIRIAFAEKGKRPQVMVSLTVSDKGGHTLSGQTLEAFVASVGDMPEIVSIGLNCSFGPKDIIPHLDLLQNISPLFTSCHPNAGLPDENGDYTESPETFTATMRGPLEKGMLNVVGGCCGTTPDHIRELAKAVKNAKVHQPSPRRNGLTLAGLDIFSVTRDGFTIIGERCNVAGSRKFLRLIKEGKYDEALSVAAAQVGKGAQVIDINLDDPLIDAPAAMERFLRLASAQPEIARVPVMIDSSDWNVIERALKNVQGKAIVNSISLKEGEEEFLRRASHIARFGAAMVVMAFDEEGQAVTFERKRAICARAYRLLIDKAGINPSDIIFDPNVLTVATGIPEHDRYAHDFIKAAEWITRNLPGAHVSGGVSNLSFSFRGQNYLREAMHSVFLHHAKNAGLDMAIVNPATLMAYEDVESKLRTLIEDLLLMRKPDATAALTVCAKELVPAEKKEASATAPDDWRRNDADARITHAVIHGISEFLESDITEALKPGRRPVEIVEGPLMTAMNRVGQLFGEGRMFLPQVVKTARTMKQAVEILKPSMETEKSGSHQNKAGKILFATVKGDVHDIGKNIVSIVLQCNNFEVLDLGVMVPASEIVEKAKELNPDLICLSGLITPSLGEMRKVAESLEEAGLSIPLMVGGAATSPLHTALKIASVYSAPVVHVHDAAQDPVVASKLLNPASRNEFLRNLQNQQESLRLKSSDSSILPLEAARNRRLVSDWQGYGDLRMGNTENFSIRIKDLLPLINWNFFLMAWGLAGKYMEHFPYGATIGNQDKWLSSLEPEFRPKAQEALRIYRDALSLLSELGGETVVAEGRMRFEKGCSEGEDIVAGELRLPMLRSQIPDHSGYCLSLADFISPASSGNLDSIGFFCVTARPFLDLLKSRDSDTYRRLLVQTLADRIAEAASEFMHRNIGLGIRPAVGYPSMPDQLLMHSVAPMLSVGDMGVEITENGALTPSSTVCGLYILNPDARYFSIQAITEEQLADYAQRRGLPIKTLSSALSKLLE